MHAKSDPAKFCAACGKQLARKRINGRLEDRGVFVKRKYCERSCMAKAMTKPDAEISKVQAHRRARKWRGSCCEHCGTSANLQVDHKDRNPWNNDPANLRTLCGSCHMKMHHARGEIVKSAVRPPCRVCGKKSYRADLCSTCRTRQRRYGSPLVRVVRRGSQWIRIPVGAK